MLTEIMMTLAMGALMTLNGNVKEAHEQLEWAVDKIEACESNTEEMTNKVIARKEVKKYFEVIEMTDDDKYVIISSSGKGICGDALEASKFINDNSDYTAVVYEDQILMTGDNNKCVYIDLEENEVWILMAGNTKFS